MRKEHFEEQTYKTKVIDEIICNKCGKKTTLKNEFPLMHYFKTDFFYGSPYDGLTLDFDLCENCLFDFTNSFKIKVKPYDELVKWAEENQPERRMVMFRYIDYQCPDCDSILKEFDDEICYCPKCKKEIPEEEAMKNIIYY